MLTNDTIAQQYEDKLSPAGNYFKENTAWLVSQNTEVTVHVLRDKCSILGNVENCFFSILHTGPFVQPVAVKRTAKSN